MIDHRLFPNQYAKPIVKVFEAELQRPALALASFRQACVKWNNTGDIPSADFLEQIQALDDAGLSNFGITLIGLALLTIEAESGKAGEQ